MHLPPDQAFHVVGRGVASIDNVAVLAEHPPPGSRSQILQFDRRSGGPVARALAAQARLGLRVKFIGQVGDDAYGTFTIHSLRASGIDVADVVRVPGTATGFDLILLSEKTGERIVCRRQAPEPTLMRVGPLQGRLLYVSGGDVQLARQARDQGLPVVLLATDDTADELLAVCDVVLAYSGFASGELRERALQASIVALTSGVAWSEAGGHEEPMVGCRMGGARGPVSLGDEDAWCGAFGYGLLRGWPIHQICHFANTVATQGTPPPEHDLPSTLRRDTLPAGACIDDAWAFAREAHRGQQRDQGEPYFAHPFRVARRLSHEFAVHDPELIAIALLHDVLEDVPVDRAYFRDRFGARIHDGVRMLTKDSSLPREERDRRYFSGLADAPADILTIKVCDRVDNLSELHLSQVKGKAERYLHETRGHYLDIARRAHPRADALLRQALDQAESALQAG